MFFSSRQSARTRTTAFSVPKTYAYLAALLTATFLFSLQAVAQVSFTQTAIASGDTSSGSIVSGDFDNDGVLDLVTSNAMTISFYKGLGGGRYAAPVNTPQTVGASFQAAAADFNRDGKLDLAVASFYNGVSILLGNGDGTFKFLMSTDNGSSESVTERVELADFNGDHIPDMAYDQCPAHSPDCRLQVYLGNGDGTFTESVALEYGGNADFVTGDFNADGHEDIAALTPEIGGVNGVTVYFGDGNGQFQSPVTYTTPGTSSLAGLAVGDFYNNRTQSLALATETYDSTNGNYSTYIQSVQYVNGAFTSSTPQLVYTNTNYENITLAAGDLDGDFKDDLVITGAYGTNARNPIDLYLLGTGAGTFGSPVSLPTYGQADETPFIRDLDLDARHDIAMDWTTDNQTGGGAYVLMNNSNFATNCTPPSANKLQVHVCAPQNGQSVEGVFAFKTAGNAFNGVVKRMELWIDGTKVGQNLQDQLNVTAKLSQGTHTAAFVAVDTFDNTASESVTFTSNGNGNLCTAPSSPGVNVCSPTQNESVTSPVNFEYAATAATGKVDHVELWIDGKKIGNYPGSAGSIDIPVSTGSHSATIVEVDSSYNYVKSAPVNFTVTGGAGCTAPSSPGVNVCSPTPNETVSSPVNIVATGTGASGKVDHLELWIDGQKIGNYSGSQMTTNVQLSAGAHQVTVVEVDSNYNYVKSAPVNFTVAGGATCSPPSSPGVNVCNPTQNESVSSPVNFMAAGKAASGNVDHLELWIDGQKIGNYAGAEMNTSVTLSSGAHSATVVEVDSTYHYIKSTPVNFTVK